LAQCRTEDEVIERARAAEVYIAWKFPVSRHIVRNLPHLRLLMASGSGFDHIDVDAATENGVVVTNAATHNVQDVADHTIALIVAVTRKLLPLDRAVRGGAWRPPMQPIHRFRALTLGLAGFGRIGQAVAERAQVLGFTVIAHGLHGSDDRMRAKGVEPVTLDELLRRSDVVSLHCQLNARTRNLIGEREFGLMKPGAFLVNTGRGALVDETALIAALEQNKLAGAGLDVLTQEPPSSDNPLLKMETVLHTGHSAASTVQAPLAWQAEWRDILSDYNAGWLPQNVVNAQVKPKAALKKKPDGKRQ
jgi:D-3-phosphoglycerate dehydrogenase